MTPEEYNSLSRREPAPQRIGAMGYETRTLLYGYDTDRRTYHVFQHDNEIHRVIYTPGADGPTIHDHKHDLTLAIDDVIPNKRVYPALSDFGFCQTLMNMGVGIPFTTYDPDRTLESRGGLAGATGIDEIDNPTSTLKI
jgi:hypothetical protein